MASLPASMGTPSPSFLSRAVYAAVSQPTVKLLCEDEELRVAPLKKIIKDAEWLGVPFNCKNAECGHCRVTVKRDRLVQASEKEKKYFGKDFRKDVRLACQMKLWGDTEIERISLST
eukprot:TRINITY_DN6880_c0_g3_i1.p1 TRINITY_DN6880_c0_g3~~TRINITY_DN6880_c0_g3_i1.p1  ORF type:complete len:117 (+),score=28.97 TRINITY_DN6880_c0_g3_i1:65-415(+)